MGINKRYTFLVVTVIILILKTFVLVKGYIDIPEQLIMSFYILFCLVIYPKAFFNRATLCLVLFIVIFISIAIVKHFNLVWFYIKISEWIFALAIWNILLYNKKYHNFRIIGKVLLLVIIVNSLLTIPWALMDASLVRNIIQTSDEALREGALKKGIVGYNFLHGLPAVFPIIIYWIKREKGFTKMWWFLLLAILYLLIVKASLGTILIISTIIIPVSFFISKSNIKNVVVLIIFIVSSTIMTTNGFIKLIENVEPYFIDTAIQPKLNDIKSSFTDNEAEGQIEARQYLYYKSWRAFFNFPLVGSTNKSDAGEHAFILDFLAWSGLFGTIPLLLFFFYLFKSAYNIVRKDTKIFFLLGISPFIILSFFKGTSSSIELIYALILVPCISFFHMKKVDIPKHTIGVLVKTTT